VPWSALAFLTLYFQLLGMSDSQASALVALFLLGKPGMRMPPGLQKQRQADVAWRLLAEQLIGCGSAIC